MRRAFRLLTAGLTAGAVITAGAGLVTADAASAATLPACGATLTSSVTLSGNLDCSSYTAGPALTIDKGHVTLNLNGHSIIGPGGSFDTQGVVIGTSDTNSPANVTVENGTIANFEYDVYVNAAVNLDLTGLKALFSAPHDYYGVYVDYGVTGGTFSSITADDAYIGIYLEDSSGVSVSHATLNGSTYGFYGEYNTDVAVNDSSASRGGTSAYGFYDEYFLNDSYTGDTAIGDEYGFYIYGDEYGAAILKSNHASRNSEYGFYLYENYLDDYTYGEYPSELVSGNTADNNGVYGIYDYYSVGASLTGNTADGNGEYGIEVEYPVQYTVDGNTTNHNTYSGIYVYGGYSYYGAKSVSDNIAESNSDYGIYANYAALGTGNVAIDNSPENCYLVHCDQAPTVTRISPNNGTTRGGTLVTIYGTNLLAPSAVHFGTKLAKIHRVISAKEIEVISPKGSGTVIVRVTVPGGTSAKSRASRFTYKS